MIRLRALRLRRDKGPPSRVATPAFNCLRVAAATKLDGELAGQESAFALDAYGEWGGGVEV